METVRTLFKKHRDILLYLFFGCVTTLVNYIVFFVLYNWAQLSGALSNGIAWAAAVAVAFVTNKPFVFKSHDWSARTLLPELIKFLGSRIGSGLLETAVIIVTVDALALNGNLMKLITGAMVMILNYAASRLIVFKN